MQSCWRSSKVPRARQRRSAHHSLGPANDALASGSLNFGAVGEAGVPIAAALRRQVQKMPDGREQIDAALVDLRAHPRMRGIKVAHQAISIAGETRNLQTCSP